MGGPPGSEEARWGLSSEEFQDILKAMLLGGFACHSGSAVSCSDEAGTCALHNGFRLNGLNLVTFDVEMSS